MSFNGLKVVLIAAMSENRVIARNSDLPWTLPEDLKRFKRVTTGHPVIMGRTTMDTLPAPLSGRRCIVLTRNPDWSHPGVEVAASLSQALDMASEAPPPDQTVYIAGGGEVYTAALEIADELDLTRVHAEIEGDVWFPEISGGAWRCVSAERHEADTGHSHAFSFERWTKAR
jgi:dihydrofolate reductase